MLNLLIVAPCLAAVVQLLGSGRDRSAALRLGLSLSLILVGLGCWVAVVDQQAVALPWFTLPGTGADVQWGLAADGLNRWLVALVVLLGPVALLSAHGSAGDRLREYAAAVFAVQGLMIGAFLATDVVLFYIFFEAMLLPMLVLIGLFGDAAERRSAGLQFFIYTMAGSIFMLVAIWYLVGTTGTADIGSLAAAMGEVDAEARLWCFLAFALAFAVKTPLVPFHGWQAPVYAACPAGAAVLLAGAMAKLGTYGFLRLVLPLFPAEAQAWAGVFIVLGLIGVVGGACMALVQRDLKRLLAYSSLSHLGLVVVGIFSLQAAAMSGAVVQMVAHGLSAAALFVLVGALEQRFGRRGIDDFGGLTGRMPVLAVCFVVAALAAAGLPGTVGFIGEFLLLIGSTDGLMLRYGPVAGILLALVAGLSLIIGAAYLLRVVQRVLHGRPQDGQLRDLGLTDGLAVAVCLVASIGLGFYPALITRSADADLAQTAAAFAPSSSVETAGAIDPAGEE